MIRKFSLRRIIGQTAILTCLSTAVLAGSAQAFEAGRIIDDPVFTNKDTMTPLQIQDFLNQKVPVCDTTHAPDTRQSQGGQPPWRCLKDYYENVDTGANNLYGNPNPAGSISAAQIIWKYAQQFSINPQVLIVTLQKENGLVTDAWPYHWQYRTAMGFACPDTAACDPTYYGFSKQVYQASRHLRNYYDENPNWTVPYKVGTRYIRWSPNASCGGSDVNIMTHGTAALYNYTPYQPNAAALSAGFGTGDVCSAYGNRNFYNYFTNWFGSTAAAPYNSSYVSQSTYPSLKAGESSQVTMRYRNVGNMSWYDIQSAPTAGKQPVKLATSHDLNRQSIFGMSWGGDRNRASGQFTRVIKNDGTAYTTNPHIVAPGEIAEFTFTISVPSGYAPGSYNEFFQPIVEGGSTMNDPWTFMTVNVLPIVKASYFRQSAYPTLPQTTSTQLSLSYTNTGNQPWYDDESIGTAPAGTMPIHLATGAPLNRASVFAQDWGNDKNRPALKFGAVYRPDGTTLAPNQHVAQVGEIVRFDFTVRAGNNLAAGNYREFFQPVQEGGLGMNDTYTFIDITVETARMSSSYVSQSEYPTILKGKSGTIYMRYRNTGNIPWYDDISAKAGSPRTKLATSHDINRRSNFADNWNQDGNRPATQFAAVYAYNTATTPDQHTVYPGQIAVFAFSVKANQPAGTYREFFQPIIEGVSTMNDPWTFQDITVQDPFYASEYSSQCAYPTVTKGGSSTCYITYKNTGNVPWYDDQSAAANNTKPVRLATSHSINRQSNFGQLWPVPKNRASQNFGTVYTYQYGTYLTNPHVVQPGEHVRFEFVLSAPTNIASGKYVEYFQPIVEGGSIMNDPWTSISITVP